MDTITVMRMKNKSYRFEAGVLSADDRATYEGKGYVITEEVGMTQREVFAKYLNLKFDKNGDHVID